MNNIARQGVQGTAGYIRGFLKFMVCFKTDVTGSLTELNSEQKQKVCFADLFEMAGGRPQDLSEEEDV